MISLSSARIVYASIRWGLSTETPRDLPVVGHTPYPSCSMIYRTHPKRQKYPPKKAIYAQDRREATKIMVIVSQK